MPAYSFETWKAAKVASGESRQTIRPVRKRRTMPGDTLYLYHGQRTKSARLLRVEKCLSVEPISFERSPIHIAWICVGRYYAYVNINKRRLLIKEVTQLAKDDGFANFDLFFAFFQTHYGIPNRVPLELIKW